MASIQHYYPAEFWVPNVGAKVPWSMAVKVDKFFMTGGQTDADRFAASLQTQTSGAIQQVFSLMDEAEVPRSDLGRLLIYYVTDGSVDESAYESVIKAGLEDA